MALKLEQLQAGPSPSECQEGADLDELWGLGSECALFSGPWSYLQEGKAQTEKMTEREAQGFSESGCDVGASLGEQRFSPRAFVPRVQVDGEQGGHGPPPDPEVCWA